MPKNWGRKTKFLTCSSQSPERLWNKEANEIMTTFLKMCLPSSGCFFFCLFFLGRSNHLTYNQNKCIRIMIVTPLASADIELWHLPPKCSCAGNLVSGSTVFLRRKSRFVFRKDQLNTSCGFGLVVWCFFKKSTKKNRISSWNHGNIPRNWRENAKSYEIFMICWKPPVTYLFGQLQSQERFQREFELPDHAAVGRSKRDCTLRNTAARGDTVDRRNPAKQIGTMAHVQLDRVNDSSDIVMSKVAFPHARV